MLNNGTVLQQRYQIIQHIGGGGMGDVYLAHDSNLDNQCVVKENCFGDTKQFVEEAKILAGLSHTNLPHVIQHFTELTGKQYLVMNYIAGDNLDQRVQKRGGKLPETEALNWFKQILSGVRYLHTHKPQPVIHRDIKPQNIIITADACAVLVDFGIAKVLTLGQTTSTGAKAATPGFAPPEQYHGRTDERSDIYALGATLYAVLTGATPPNSMDRESGSAILVSPRDLNSTISKRTEKVILKGMDLDQSRRYRTIEAVEQALFSPGCLPLPNQIDFRKIVAIGCSLLVVVLLCIGLLFIVIKSGIPFATPTAIAIRPTFTFTPTPTPTVVTPSPTPTHTTPSPTPSPTPTSTPICIVNESLAIESAWASTWDAEWGNRANWSAPGYLHATRSGYGSSARVVSYEVKSDTTYNRLYRK